MAGEDKYHAKTAGSTGWQRRHWGRRLHAGLLGISALPDLYRQDFDKMKRREVVETVESDSGFAEDVIQAA
jgi:hypothetical protein